MHCPICNPKTRLFHGFGQVLRAFPAHCRECTTPRGRHHAVPWSFKGVEKCRAIAAVVILLAGWFGYDYYKTQQDEKAAIAAAEAEAAAAEAAAAEAAAQAAAEAEAAAAAAEAAAAEAAAALEAAAAEAAAAAQDALDAAAAQLDPDALIALIARIEASNLSVVEKNLLKAIVEAARNSPELLQGAADQIAEKIGN